MRGALRSTLSNVLEERTGQHRQVEFDMEDDEEHAEKAAPDSHLQKLAGIGHDRRREKKGFRDLDQFFTKGHIFENEPIRKSTELLEQCAADEESLVAVNDPAADAAEIVQKRDQFEPPITAGELVHEPTGLNGLVGFHLVEPLDRS